MRHLFHMLAAGKLPFRAEIVSESGEEGSMQVGDVSVTIDGTTRVLMEDTLTLSTNKVPGDKTAISSAHIEIPVDGRSQGSIVTKGNATVQNASAPARPLIGGGKNKIKVASPTGLFVVARVGHQRDTNQGYFDFLFGTQGQSEEPDDSGRKQRPHIAIHTDGNGKYLRSGGHDCELVGQMRYDAKERRVCADAVKIRSLVHNETIEAHFTCDASGAVVLDSISFT